MWVLCVKTYSLDQCPHSLSANRACSAHCYTHTHQNAQRAPRAPFIHPGNGCYGCLHFPLRLSPPRTGTADFVFGFFPFLVGVVVDDINRAPFPVTSAILRSREESEPEDTRITTETGARDFVCVCFGVFFSLLPLERIKSGNKTPFKFGRIFWHRCWGIKGWRLADGCRFRGEESLALRKVSDAPKGKYEPRCQQRSFWLTLTSFSHFSFTHNSQSFFTQSIFMWNSCWDSECQLVVICKVCGFHSFSGKHAHMSENICPQQFHSDESRFVALSK